MKSSWDVLVVGGGIGGMTTALLLAKKGYSVALIEPSTPGNFRVGESLDWEAPLFFKRLGFSPEKWIREEKATLKKGAVVSSSAQPGKKHEIGFALIYRILQNLVGRGHSTLHINREKIDVEWMDRLLQTGVTWLQTRVKQIEHTDQKIQALVLQTGETVSAKFYIDATGRHTLFRRIFHIDTEWIGAKKVAIRARFPHRYDAKGTRIRTDDSLQDPAWIWDIHVSETSTDIGLVVTERDFRNLYAESSSLAQLFYREASKHDDLAWLLPLIQEDTPFWTCTFQNGIAHQSSGENWIAVGESAFLVDAILSSGITVALRSGFLSSKIIMHSLKQNQPQLSLKWRTIYHEKTSSQVRTVNTLIEVFWYQGRLRQYYSLLLNVLSILVVNFNLNHFHTRYLPRTLWELTLLKKFHSLINRFIPYYNLQLTRYACRRKQKKIFSTTRP